MGGYGWLTDGADASAGETVKSTHAVASMSANITGGRGMKLIYFGAEYKLSISYCLIALPQPCNRNGPELPGRKGDGRFKRII
jgi:hypothetical protein